MKNYEKFHSGDSPIFSSLPSLPWFNLKIVVRRYLRNFRFEKTLGRKIPSQEISAVRRKEAEGPVFLSAVAVWGGEKKCLLGIHHQTIGLHD